MRLLTTIIAAAFVAGNVLTAGAQSPNTAASASANGSVSAATHCKDSKGQVQLKSAMKGSGKVGSTTAGSAGVDTAASATGAAGMESAAGAKTPAGSATTTGSGTTGTAASLPNC